MSDWDEAQVIPILKWVITSSQKVSQSQCPFLYTSDRRGQINADGQLIRERLLSAAASHEIWSTLSAFSLQKSSRVGEQRAWTQKNIFCKKIRHEKYLYWTQIILPSDRFWDLLDVTLVGEDPPETHPANNNNKSGGSISSLCSSSYHSYLPLVMYYTHLMGKKLNLCCLKVGQGQTLVSKHLWNLTAVFRISHQLWIALQNSSRLGDWLI